MKILIDPVYTSRKMSKCSTYFALKEAALAFLGADDNNFVYCCVPDTEFNDQFINDDLVEHERWLNVPVQLGRDRYQNMFFPRDDMMKFANSGDYWDWDVLLTTRNNGWFWRLMSRKNDDQKFRKLLILVEPFPMMTFKTTVTGNPEKDIAILNSYLAFDRVFIQTEWERKKIIESARHYLSASRVAKLTEKVVTTFPAPDLDYDYPNNSGVEKPEETKLIYVQRLDENERRVTKMLDVLRKAFVVSGDIEVIISTNSAGFKNIDDTGFIDKKQLPRDEFYELLKDATCYLTWSRDEGMPFSLLEADAFGVIPIAKRELWSEDYYGKDYWGLVNSMEEAVTRIRWIKENREAAYKMFIAWYKSFRLPYVQNYGNQRLEQKRMIDRHWQKLNEDLRASREGINLGKDYLSELVNNSDSQEFNLNDPKALAGLEGMRTKNRKIVPIDVPMSRQRDYYPDRIRLLMVNGWQDMLQPGTMRRSA